MTQKLFNIIAFCSLGLLLLTGCGGSKDTTQTVPIVGSMEQRFQEGKTAYAKKEWLDAIRIFEDIRIQSPTSAVAPEATYLEAMARFNQELFSGAAVDFRAIRRNYPNSPFAARAQYMVGESYYQLSPRPELDQNYSIYASNEFQIFLRDYPNAPQTLLDSAQHRIQEVRNKLAHKIYNAADLYTKMEESKAAIIYFNRVLDMFYDTPYAPESQLRIAEIQYDRGKLDDARSSLDKFEEKYLRGSDESLRKRALYLRSKL